MMRKATSAVRNGPTDTRPPGCHSSKFGAPPALASNSTMILVKAVTTAAKAAPMTNATASSTRLPRMMKSLKPFMGFLVPLVRGYRAPSHPSGGAGLGNEPREKDTQHRELFRAEVLSRVG